MSKKPEHWLFTDWSLYMNEFKIFTSYEDIKGLKITLNDLKKPDGHIPIKKQL